MSPKLIAYLKEYFTSDRYKRSQQFLQNIVYKNTMKRYNKNVTTPPKEP